MPSKLILIAMALVLVAALPARSDAEQSDSHSPAGAKIMARPGRLAATEVTFPNAVKARLGLIYAEPEGYRPLTLDLYLPPQQATRPAGGFPLVLYIHGGGWLGGTARRSGPFADFPAVLAALAARGYVVASVEYRLSGEAKFPAQVQDVKAVLRWLRSRAPEFGIDPRRAVAWGASAGAYLAALTALSCGAAEFDPAQASPAERLPSSDTSRSGAISDCV